MIDRVAVRLEMAAEAPAVCDRPLAALADLFQEQLVDRLRAGADYGNFRGENNEVLGHWNIYLDGEEPVIH
jgi:hypothetical protein